jgi:tight adherence protein B
MVASALVVALAVLWRALLRARFDVAARRRVLHPTARSFDPPTPSLVAQRLGLPGDPHLAGAGVIATVTAAPLLGWRLAGPIVAIAVGGAAVAGIAWLHRTAPARRAVAADGQLPTVLEGVARRLRAGASLAQAIAEATPPDGTPLAPSWARMTREARAFGLATATETWGGEAARPAVRLAGAALCLAAETGGATARAVDGVAATIRSQLAIAAEVRALSSQARASTAVIVVAPLAFGVLAGASDPRTSAFLATRAGTAVVLAGLTLDAVGAWWMARLCRVRS